VKCKKERISYLAFDVDSLERLLSSSFEKRACFTGQEGDVLRPVFQQIPTMVINDELGSISVRLKPEFLSDETKLDIWLISAAGN
jgi:hypothetical protein